MTNKYKILRIGSYPTEIYNTIGMHTRWLNKHEEFETTHITPYFPGKTLNALGKTDIIKYKFDTRPRNKTNNFFLRFISNLIRVLSIIIFSFLCLRVLINRSFDIVHIHSPMYILIALIGKLFGKKIFITYHGEDFYIIKDSYIFKHLAKYFDHVFSLSPDYVNELKKIHKTNVSVVFNGLDQNTFKHLEDEKSSTILMVASYKKQKNHMMFLNVFSNFIKIKKHFRLILIGEGRLRSKVYEHACKLGIIDHISFTDYMNSYDLNKMYNRSEIFVLPSNIEGFPKVLLEAIACHCKIVASDLGSNKFILGENYPYLTIKDDEKDFLDKLLKICDAEIDVNLYSIILNKFSWDKIYIPYLEVYNSMTKN